MRQQVAEDMHFVLAFYDDEHAITNKDTYKQLQQVFEEHCQVVEDAVTVRPKSGARALQSLSDPDATYDGHKGRGHQAQLSETCSDNNDVQLITDVWPQTAADTDSEALPEIVQRLEDKQRKPEVLLADGGYGSDGNVQHCATKDIELVAPAKRRQEGNRDVLTALDCQMDDTTMEVTRCPADHKPYATHYNADTGEGYAMFRRETCQTCPLLERCLVFQDRNQYKLKYSDKTLRLDTRRRAQELPEFKERYRVRSGVEGLMSALKRGYGFGRLRIRGQSAVIMTLYLKAAGYNLMQAARWAREQHKTTAEPPKAKKEALLALFLLRHAPNSDRQHLASAIGATMDFLRSTTPATDQWGQTVLAG